MSDPNVPASSPPDLAARLLAEMPYAVESGVVLTETRPEVARGRLDWSAGRCTAGGMLHGGVLMTLADTVGAVCGYLNLPKGAGTATIESKTNFFRGVGQGTVRAVARPLHVGGTLIVVQTDVYDDRERRVSQTTQTQAVIAPRPPAAA